MTLQTYSAGLIIRQKEPVNLETPFDQVDSYLTPTELFYIRSHFPAPKLEIASYQLRIDGAVSNPLSLSYQQLRDMPSETRVATLECAGNGRVFLVPQVPGAQWELGAVGNAEWTGVPLAALLERPAWKTDACEIVLEGADRGIAERAADSARPDLVCPELAPRQSASAGSADRVPDERPRSAAGSRLPGARHCPRSLRHGFGQVADAYPGRAGAVSEVTGRRRTMATGIIVDGKPVRRPWAR